jgi:hypothetical protein
VKEGREENRNRTEGTGRKERRKEGTG